MEISLEDTPMIVFYLELLNETDGMKSERKLITSGEIGVCLDRSFVTKYFPPQEVDNSLGIKVLVENFDNRQLIIEDFKHVHVSGFEDRRPSISYIKVIGSEKIFRLNNVTAKRLDVEKGNLLLAGAEVEQLNVGMEEEYKRLLNHQDSPVDVSSNHGIDLRYSNIKKCSVYVPQERIHVNDSSIGRLVIEQKAMTQNLYIYENSLIERLTISSTIKTFFLANSSISDLEFGSESKIDSTDFKAYTISRSYNCQEETIVQKSTDVWSLILSSARQSNNVALYSRAGYQYMRSIQETIPSKGKRFGYWLFDKTCGYGFRPTNAIISSIVVWLIFSIIFTILTVFGQGLKFQDTDSQLIQVIGNSLYYSAITFTTTGYGDVIPESGWAKLFAGIEAVTGLALSAILIFSLTKRYGSSQ